MKREREGEGEGETDRQREKKGERDEESITPRVLIKRCKLVLSARTLGQI